MQTNRIDFESGFALLKIPYGQRPAEPTPIGSSAMFKRVSVLTESNVSYAVKSFETNVKR